MAVHEFDNRLNEILRLRDEVELALLGNKSAAIQDNLAKGLGVSCLLLKDIAGDDVIGGIAVSRDAWATLSALKKKGQLSIFLQAERALLNATCLEQQTVDELILGLESVLGAIIEQRGHLTKHWKDVLAGLTKQVCQSASQAARVNERQSYLKRAFFAAGGALVALVNLVPPTGVPVPQSLATISAAVGINMINHATEGFMDDLRLSGKSGRASH